MPGDFVSGSVSEFQELVADRMRELFYEGSPPTSRGAAFKGNTRRHFVMPLGLLLVIDEANGGDITARELAKRFHLLHEESGNIIDFYFLGWEWTVPGNRSKGIRFNLDSFKSCRIALRRLGIKSFGGNADLILVDAHHWFQPSVPGASKAAPKGVGPSGITLDFREAIHVNLSSQKEEKEIPPVGEFLQSIIRAAEEVRASVAGDDEAGVVFSISDTLGLATAKKSVLDFIYEKWGSIIGARRLAALTVRNLGPMVKLEDLSIDAIAQGAA